MEQKTGTRGAVERAERALEVEASVNSAELQAHD